MAATESIVVLIAPFSPAWAGFYEIEKSAQALPWAENTFHSCTGATYRNRGLWVNGRAVGFSICQVVADEVTLMNIAVDPQFQGQGFGAALLIDVLESCSYAGKLQCSVFLDVRASNVAAIALYRKFGFNQTGQRPGYYPAVGPQGKAETALLFSVLSGETLPHSGHFQIQR